MDEGCRTEGAIEDMLGFICFRYISLIAGILSLGSVTAVSTLSPAFLIIINNQRDISLTEVVFINISDFEININQNLKNTYLKIYGLNGFWDKLPDGLEFR